MYGRAWHACCYSEFVHSSVSLLCLSLPMCTGAQATPKGGRAVAIPCSTRRRCIAGRRSRLGQDGARVSGILTERVDMDQTFCVTYDATGTETKRVTKEKAEIEELKAQLLATGGTDAGIATFCKVCMAKPVTRVLRPCAHACLCDECESRISNDESTSSARYSRRCYRCPVCRQLTRSSDSIILS